MEKAISIYEKIPNHELYDAYRQSLNNLAVDYKNVDDEKSIELFVKLLLIEKKYNIEDSLITMSNMADIYKDIDNEKALYYAMSVLKARQRLYPDDSDEIRISFLRIASIYGHSGNDKKAIYYSEKARTLAEKLYEKYSEEYARSTQNTGAYYLIGGDKLKSIEYMK